MLLVLCVHLFNGIYLRGCYDRSSSLRSPWVSGNSDEIMEAIRLALANGFAGGKIPEALC